jgi:hypothetical protein
MKTCKTFVIFPRGGHRGRFEEFLGNRKNKTKAMYKQDNVLKYSFYNTNIQGR